KVVIHVEKQKVSDRQLIQLGRDIGMHAHTIQRIAEDQGFTGSKIIEELDTHLIASATDSTETSVPDRECKVAEQMVDAMFSKGVVGVQDEFRIRRRGSHLVTL